MSNTQKILVPSELKPQLDIVLITNVEGLQQAQDYLSTVNVFAFDVETNMTDDFTERKIRTIQFGDRQKQYVIDLLPFAKAADLTLEQAFAVPYKPNICMQPIVNLLKQYLESSKHIKVGHNIQFDYEMIKYNLGIRMFGFYDTFLAEKVIYAGKVPFNISGFWALDDLVLRYTGLIMSKGEQTSFNLVDDLNELQIVYCALDCRLPMAVKIGQLLTLEEGKLWKALHIENNVIPAFGDMYLNGLGVDKKKWLKVVFKYKKLYKKMIGKLDEFFIPVVGTKQIDEGNLLELEAVWRNDENKETRAIARKEFMAARKRVTELKNNYKKYAGQAAINYASPVVLYNTMKKFPKFVEANKIAESDRRAPKFKDTGDRTLKNFAEHPTWDLEKVMDVDPNLEHVGMIDTLRLYREAEKLLNAFGTDWLRKYVNKKTGRVHGRLNQLGADTGRSSCSKPNMQQLPRGDEWRSCFVSRVGYKIITMDLSGAELVILAELSQDPVFVHAYRHGWDVHSVVAEIVFKEEWEAGTIHEPTVIRGKLIPKCAYYYPDSNNEDHKKCGCPEHKRTRTKAKPCGLGMAYGMEAGKLADQIGVSFEEAERIIKKFRESFVVLIEYLTKSGNDTKEKYESRSLAGRRRWMLKPEYKRAAAIAKKRLEEKGILDKAPTSQQISWCLRSMYSAIEREGKNNPLQSSNADISKIAMGCDYSSEGLPMMWQGLTKYDAGLVMFVHDEFLVEVPDEYAKECALYMEKVCIAAAAELIKSVPMGVEYDIKNYWKK